MNRRRVATQGGFTLIEIMVVLVIIAILGTFVTLKVIDRPDQARHTKVLNDVRAIEAALNLYRLDSFDYPATEDGLEALVPKYLDRLPKDPWNNPYLYLSPGAHGEVDVFTLGRDGVEGGQDADADLGNWSEG